MSLSASAQTERSPAITVTSRLVVLDVRVLDAKGNFVNGLDRSQFAVFEDKAEQRIRNFEPPESHVLPATGKLVVSGTANLVKIGPIPVNILVMDELNTAFENSARTQQAIRAYLQAQPEVLPVPMLLLASGARKLTVLHDFTQSRAELLASLKSHFTDFDPRMLNNTMARGAASAADGFAKTLGALSMVASSVRGIAGHKNVIWVSSGFDQAYDLTSASDSDAQQIAAALKLVTSRMMAARMSLSTIDPNGVDAFAPEENADAEAWNGGGPSSITDFDQAASFDELARTTGGLVVHGRNDLEDLVAQDSAAVSAYYTISYAPTSRSDAAQDYRHIRVVMKNPNLHAVTRTGYYANGSAEAPVIPDKPRNQTREFRFDLLSAGGSRMVYTGLHVHAAPSHGGYNVQVEAAGLTWKTQDDGTRIAEVSIVGAAFDKRDKVLMQVAREYKERINASDSVNGVRVGFNVPLFIPANTVRVRFVVRDASTGVIGSEDLPK